MIRRNMVGFRDPIRSRHAVLLASVIGLVRAGKQLGISPSLISEWRERLEAQTGETFPRLPAGRPPGFGKLDLEKARDIRARLARGVSSGVLGRLFKVHPGTIRRVGGGELYPEPAMERAA